MSFDRAGGPKGMDTITPCLWFDTEGEAAANFYVSVFPDSRILEIGRYTEGTARAGSVMVVSFEINGQKFTALNGGPQFKHTEGISFKIPCDSQDEVDHYWTSSPTAAKRGPAAG